MKLWRSLSLALLAAVSLIPAGAGTALAAPPAVPAAITAQGASYAETILTKVNQLRARLGLEPVVRYVELDDIAQDWSEQLVARGTLAHRPNFADSYPSGWSSASENVAMRSPGGDIGALIFDQWLNSPGHYANMTAPEANSIGIGVAQGSDGWYATQNFAAYPDANQMTVSSPPSSAASSPAPTTRSSSVSASSAPSRSPSPTPKRTPRAQPRPSVKSTPSRPSSSSPTRVSSSPSPELAQQAPVTAGPAVEVTTAAPASPTPVESEGPGVVAAVDGLGRGLPLAGVAGATVGACVASVLIFLARRH